MANAQIEGTVMSRKAFKRHGNIYTKNTIQTKHGTQDIITRGGILGLEAEFVSHTPQLETGQKGRFYSTSGYLTAIEHTQSFVMGSVIVNPTQVRAGVQDVILISGSGFGSQTDNVAVGFSDANFGGSIYFDVLPSQIKSWSDTQILVEVPSRAGTGPVRLLLDDGTVLISDPITVVSSVINLNYNGIAFRTQHVDSYTWHYNNDVPNLARTQYENALNAWRCNTGIAWYLGSDTNSNTIAADNVNLVLFADLGVGLLGQCTSRYRGCPVEDGIIWYVNELDIVFNTNRNWNYLGSPEVDETDFLTVAMHELGHGHQLGHVIDRGLLMHYSLGNGTQKTNLDSFCLDAANGVQNINTSRQACGAPLMQDFECALGLQDVEYDYENADKTYYNILGQEVKKPNGLTIIKYQNAHGIRYKKQIIISK